jgi:hypothetical protein
MSLIRYAPISVAQMIEVGIPGAVYRALGLEPGALFSGGPIVGAKWTQDCWEPAEAAPPFIGLRTGERARR